jgi:hypothetical protein
MILLTIGVAVLDEHARLACLETSTSLFAAIGTALNHHVVIEIVHRATIDKESERRSKVLFSVDTLRRFLTFQKVLFSVEEACPLREQAPQKKT